MKLPKSDHLVQKYPNGDKAGDGESNTWGGVKALHK